MRKRCTSSSFVATWLAVLGNTTGRANEEVTKYSISLFGMETIKTSSNGRPRGSKFADDEIS